MTRAALFALMPLTLVLSACGDAEEPTAIEDPSKLSEELEAEARAIEQRADTAAREAEALAQQELDQLHAKVEAAAAAAGTGTQDAPPEVGATEQ